MAPVDLTSKQVGLRVALFLGAVGVGLTPAADGDLFWHLAAGREMVRSGAILTSDPFSVSAAGRSWTDVHWLFQLGLYGLYQLGGLAGLVIAKCLLVGAGAWLLLAAIDRPDAGRTPAERGPLPALFVTLFLGALFFARHLLLVRPVIVTLLFLAFFFHQLERFRRGGDPKSLVPLPFVQVLWANCQGLSALGLALVGAYALGAGLFAAWGDRRWLGFAEENVSARPARPYRNALLMTLALCALGSCLTPFGFRAARLPFELLTRLVPHAHNVYAANVAENVPPFSLQGLEEGTFWHLRLYIAVLAVSFALASRRLVASHLIIVTGFVGLALLSNRNVLLLYWMATPIAAMSLAPAARRLILSTHRGPLLARWIGRAAFAGVLLVIGTAASRESSLAAPAPFHFPEESAALIAQRPGQGQIFAADHFGGYLMWKLFPRFRPYIDTRLVLRSPQEFADYLGVVDEPERFDAFTERYAFDYVVLPVAHPDRYLRLIAHLYDKKEWVLLFTDGAETLFAKRTPRDEAVDLGSRSTTDRILARADRRFADAPRLRDEAHIELATLDIVLGEVAEAERILDPLPSATALRARARLLMGDVEGAMNIGERLLDADKTDVRSLDLLGMAYLRRGDVLHATEYIRRALTIDPLDGEANNILLGLEHHQQEEQRHGH